MRVEAAWLNCTDDILGSSLLFIDGEEAEYLATLPIIIERLPSHERLERMLQELGTDFADLMESYRLHDCLTEAVL